MLWSTGICLHWRPFKSIHLYWLNPNMSRQIYQQPLFSEGSERREMRCMWTECPCATLLDYNFVFERQHEIWSDPIYCLKYIPLVFLCLLGLIIYHYSKEQKCFVCTMYCTDGGWCQPSCFPTIWYGDHYSQSNQFPMGKIKSRPTLFFQYPLFSEILLCWHKPSPSKQGKYGNITRFSRFKGKVCLSSLLKNSHHDANVFWTLLSSTKSMANMSV